MKKIPKALVTFAQESKRLALEFEILSTELDRIFGDERWIKNDMTEYSRFTADEKIKIGDYVSIDDKTGKAKKWRGSWRPVGIFDDSKTIIGETKMAKKKTVSPFKKGRAEVKRGGGNQFLSVKVDDPQTFAPLVGLDGLVSAEMHEYWDIRPAIYHPCIGRGCPGCQVGNEGRFKGYLPVLTKGGETVIYPFTISVYNQLENLEDSLDEGDSLKGFAIKVSRKGAGLATRYTVLGLGKRVDVSEVEMPDFISQLGPQTKGEIWDLLESNGFARDEGDSTETPKIVKVEAPDSAADGDDDDWGSV